MEEENQTATINFKIPVKMRDEFKLASKKNGGNMQSVLFVMVKNYIENSEHFKLQLVDSRHQND